MIIPQPWQRRTAEAVCACLAAGWMSGATLMAQNQATAPPPPAAPAADPDELEAWQHIAEIEHHMDALFAKAFARADALLQGMGAAPSPASIRMPSLLGSDPQAMMNAMQARMAAMMQQLEHESATIPGFNIATFVQRPPSTQEFAAADRGDHYELELPVPRDGKVDLDVITEGGVLTIRSRESNGQAHSLGLIQWQTHSSSAYQRSFPLPPDADPDRVSSKVENGKLLVTVPKKVFKNKGGAASAP